MADCARGRSVRYLRVQLNAILGSSYKTLVLWSKIERNTKRWYLILESTIERNNMNKLRILLLQFEILER